MLVNTVLPMYQNTWVWINLTLKAVRKVGRLLHLTFSGYLAFLYELILSDKSSQNNIDCYQNGLIFFPVSSLKARKNATILVIYSQNECYQGGLIISELINYGQVLVVSKYPTNKFLSIKMMVAELH